MAHDRTDLWTTPPAELLRPGGGFDLADMDRGDAPGWSGGKKDSKAFLADRAPLLSELQERLFAHGRTGGDRSVLLVIQGLDTAGKGGVVRHVIGMVDPQGVALRAFGVPTAQERRHHYLWRVRRALPKPGMIGVFDRSHYEDVLVPRVQGEIDEEVWKKRYREINRFEERVAAAGTTIIKVALMPSYEEQGLRLMERLDRPEKHWKFDPGDVDTRLRWDDYQAAYADVFANTHTDAAPWHVIPADRKWYTRLVVTELLTQALIDLGLGWPRPRWRVATQKRRLAETMSEESLAEAAEKARKKAAQFQVEEEAYAATVNEVDDDGPVRAEESAADDHMDEPATSRRSKQAPAEKKHKKHNNKDKDKKGKKKS
ncbi:hypothetical protein GCM10023169_15630 [Georgenia halophila]|uniref:Polyphosphate kinase-2-related domain-containing protein n=1 Tax=Georgenia halophila TaxID=620889 RepID=A0ABP8L4E7_9MICO